MIQTPALDWVRVVAERLGELRDEVVFLGGAAVGLLITDPAAAAVRPTKDVDVIVELRSKAEYDTRLREALLARGFAEDTSEGAPPCRWTVQDLKVDVMPTRAEVLGFTNRWYEPAMATAQTAELAGQLRVRLISPAYFLATKLEAFRGRGEGDFQASHDLEDLIALVDGRPELQGELEAADPQVRAWIQGQLMGLLDTPAFVDARLRPARPPPHRRLHRRG